VDAPLQTPAPIEVIDLDSCDPEFCSCHDFGAMEVRYPVSRIVFGLPAVLPPSRLQQSSEMSRSTLDVAEDGARKERREYASNRYKRHREIDLNARVLARASPRRSLRLQRS